MVRGSTEPARLPIAPSPATDLLVQCHSVVCGQPQGYWCPLNPFTATLTAPSLGKMTNKNAKLEIIKGIFSLCVRVNVCVCVCVCVCVRVSMCVCLPGLLSKCIVFTVDLSVIGPSNIYNILQAGAVKGLKKCPLSLVNHEA